MSPGGVKTPMESLTTTWQAGGGTLGIGVVLNTQLVPGAATSTTESGAACAPDAAPKSPAMTAPRIVIFTAIDLPSKYSARVCPSILLKIVFRQRPAIPIVVLAGFRLHLASGTARPVLPGAVERVGRDPADDLVDLAGGENFDLAHLTQRHGHRLHLQLGAELEIDRHENRMAHRAADHGGAVAAHQRRRLGVDELGEVAAHGHVADQERGVAELVMGIPDRHFVAHRGAHVQQRFQFLAGDAERDRTGRMVVHHGVHVRPRLVDGAVDEALQIGSAAAFVDRGAVESIFDEVVALDALGRARPRQQKMLWIVWMASADMAE